MGKEYYTEYPLTKEPVNITAKKVTSPGWKHVGYENRSTGSVPHWEDCPHFNPKGLAEYNLTGKKFGRGLIVLGVYLRPLKVNGYSKKRRVNWLVKCPCGRFEVRTKKAILNPANSEDCCHKCRWIISERRAENHRQSGYKKT